MTPEQALANLEQVVVQSKLTREEHNILAECVRILAEAIKPVDKPKE